MLWQCARGLHVDASPTPLVYCFLLLCRHHTQMHRAAAGARGWTQLPEQPYNTSTLTMTHRWMISRAHCDDACVSCITIRSELDAASYHLLASTHGAPCS